MTTLGYIFYGRTQIRMSHLPALTPEAVRTLSDEQIIALCVRHVMKLAGNHSSVLQDCEVTRHDRGLTIARGNGWLLQFETDEWELFARDLSKEQILGEMLLAPVAKIPMVGA